jgi:hypothetical protein
MKSFIIYSLLFLVSFVEAGKSRLPTFNPMLGHHQTETKLLFENLAEGKWSIRGGNSYNAEFRPPISSLNSDINTPNHTLVQISFKEMEATFLNDTDTDSMTTTVNGMFVKEYTDSRLEFEAPKGK